MKAVGTMGRLAPGVRCNVTSSTSENERLSLLFVPVAPAKFGGVVLVATGSSWILVCPFWSVNAWAISKSVKLRVDVGATAPPAFPALSPFVCNSEGLILEAETTSMGDNIGFTLIGSFEVTSGNSFLNAILDRVEVVVVVEVLAMAVKGFSFLCRIVAVVTILLVIGISDWILEGRALTDEPGKAN